MSVPRGPNYQCGPDQTNLLPGLVLKIHFEEEKIIIVKCPFVNLQHNWFVIHGGQTLVPLIEDE